MLYLIPGFNLIKKPILSGIGANLANELIDVIARALRTILILQNGALFGSLALGVYLPVLGDMLFLAVYVVIIIYGLYSIYEEKRFVAFVLEQGSIRKAIGKELMAQIHDRIGTAGLVVGCILFDMQTLANETGDYIWEIAKGMLTTAAIVLALNLIVVRMTIIPVLHHRLFS
ncbi:MAG TPA: hypothetical protein VJ001_13630 [Rhodocyclaceae bacterium]|nr:hypothetical protein [Rhodocyclaceae bacterium]